MEPAELSQQYYVGMNGEQSGPFPEHEVISQIQQGLITREALVWHEGMPDWQPITNIDRFNEIFAGGGSSPEAALGGLLEDLTTSDEPWGTPPPSETPKRTFDSAPPDPEKKPKSSVTKKGLKKFRHSEVSTFAFSDKEAKPIYRDGVIRSAGKYLKRRFSLVFFGGILFAVGYGGYHLFLSVIDPDGSGETEEVPQKKTKRFPKSNRNVAQSGAVNNVTPGTAATQKPIPAVDNSVRAAELQKAKADLLLNPDSALPILERLIEANPEDAVGKDALDTALLHYKTNQRRADIGRLYLKAKQYLPASKVFLEAPPQYDLADQALFAAYQQSRASDRADLLVQDIELLLGPMNRPDVAKERIKILEKDFPRRQHPFGYYLKSIDGRIADIFSRLSFYFVQSLLQHVNTEFSTMSFVDRPVVEILRLRDGKYRIVGRYRGDVLLRRDKLSDIVFIFWLDGDQWKLVETNVTEDRARFAEQEKQNLQKRTVLATTMLENLETLFRSRFPKSRLHEAVSESSESGRGNASDE